MSAETTPVIMNQTVTPELQDDGGGENVVLEVLAELANSDRTVAPDGTFRPAASMTLDREFLRRFYREPFVFKVRISNSLGQESQSNRVTPES